MNTFAARSYPTRTAATSCWRRLRCTCLRVKLIDNELAAIGTALKGGFISPEAALEWAEEVAPGCISFIPEAITAEGAPALMTVQQLNQDDAAVLRNDEAYGQRVARATEKLLSRFISYPSIHCRKARVLWIMHTHVVYDHFDATPRLAFLSPEPASGKTRALELTERLVPNPVPTVNVSPAYLFRKVGAGDGTVLLDEIDTVFGPKAKDNEDIRGLLNAGHRRGAVVGRCVVKGKTIETEEVPAFAPVALAGLGWLPDTIMSRAIVIRMQRRAANETVEP